MPQGARYRRIDHSPEAFCRSVESIAMATEDYVRIASPRIERVSWADMGVS